MNYLSYYMQAKENGWQPTKYILKVKINPSLKFESVYGYTELIHKLVEYEDWNLPIEFKIIEDSNGNKKDVTLEILDEVRELYYMLRQRRF